VKIKNIEATEEAKLRLLWERQNKSDGPSAFVPSNMAVNFVQHNRCKLAFIRSIVVLLSRRCLFFLFLQSISKITVYPSKKKKNSFRRRRKKKDRWIKNRKPQTIIITRDSRNSFDDIEISGNVDEHFVRLIRPRAPRLQTVGDFYFRGQRKW